MYLARGRRPYPLPRWALAVCGIVVLASRAAAPSPRRARRLLTGAAGALCTAKLLDLGPVGRISAVVGEAGVLLGHATRVLALARGSSWWRSNGGRPPRGRGGGVALSSGLGRSGRARGGRGRGHQGEDGGATDPMLVVIVSLTTLCGKTLPHLWYLIPQSPMALPIPTANSGRTVGTIPDPKKDVSAICKVVTV